MALVTGMLAILTLISQEWIELLFGVDPDRGSGALEWAIVVACLMATVLLSVLAQSDLRKARLAAAG